MGVLLLWLCFLAVLAAIALAVSVLTRDARLHLAARRAGATQLRAVAAVPVARVVDRQPRTTQVSGRGLGQLIPTARTSAPARSHEAPTRGLGHLVGGGLVSERSA